MNLAHALSVAYEVTPSPARASEALSALRDFYLARMGIAGDAEAARGDRRQTANLPLVRFPADMDDRDLATALTMLAHGRNNIVGVGTITLHADMVAGVIWGFDGVGQASLAAGSVDGPGAAVALRWAVQAATEMSSK